MTYLTALEITGNYPDNILIDAQKSPNSNDWTSLMYMVKNGDIHKLMLSFNDFPFKSEAEAVLKMKEAAQAAIDYVNKEKAKG